MNKKRLLGAVLVLVGIVLIINSQVGLTGAVIGAGEIGSWISLVLGLVLLGGGVVVLMAKEREPKVGGLEKKTEKLKAQIKQELKSGKVGTYDHLKKLARDLNYRLEDLRNGHTGVYLGIVRITEIPNHRGDAPKGLYRGVLNALYDNVA